MGQDVPPPVGQVADSKARCNGSRGKWLRSADRADPGGREQVADRIGQHRGHRAEQPDRGPAERRSDHRGGPGRGLKSPVRDEQVLRPHERLQVRAARRVEGDLSCRDDDRDDQELSEGEPAECERGWDGQHGREPGQVHRHHHRPLAVELHPRPERHRDHRPHRQPRRGQHRHLGRPGVQHQDRDQGKRTEPEPRAVHADRVRRPEPPELPSQRTPACHAPIKASSSRAEQTTARPASHNRPLYP